MRAETKEFLLKEYEHVWKQVLDIQNTRNKAIALYFTIFSVLS